MHAAHCILIPLQGLEWAALSGSTIPPFQAVGLDPVRPSSNNMTEGG